MVKESHEDDLDHKTLNDKEQMYLINTLNDSLIYEGIIDQIDNFNAESVNTNYMSIFESRVRYLTFKYSDNSDFKEELDNLLINFYRNILKKMCDVYGLSINLESYSTITIGTIAQMFYSFFVLNHKNNLILFLYNYIHEYKKSLASLYSEERIKDVKLNALKKIYKNRNEILILYNANDVIFKILEDMPLPVDVIKYMIADNLDVLENLFVHDFIIQEGEIGFTPNFINNYFDILINRKTGYLTLVSELEHLLMETMSKVNT